MVYKYLSKPIFCSVESCENKTFRSCGKCVEHCDYRNKKPVRVCSYENCKELTVTACGYCDSHCVDLTIAVKD